MFFIYLFICGIVWFIMDAIKVIRRKRKFRWFLLQWFLIFFLLHLWIAY